MKAENSKNSDSIADGPDFVTQKINLDVPDFAQNDFVTEVHIGTVGAGPAIEHSPVAIEMTEKSAVKPTLSDEERLPTIVDSASSKAFIIMMACVALVIGFLLHKNMKKEAEISAASESSNIELQDGGDLSLIAVPPTETTAQTTTTTTATETVTVPPPETLAPATDSTSTQHADNTGVILAPVSEPASPDATQPTVSTPIPATIENRLLTELDSSFHFRGLAIDETLVQEEIELLPPVIVEDTTVPIVTLPVISMQSIESPLAKAQRLLKEKDYKGALTAFQQLEKTAPKQSQLGQIKSYIGLDQKANAYPLLLKFLSSPQNATHTEAKNLYKKLSDGKASYLITTTPGAATITVNGIKLLKNSPVLLTELEVKDYIIKIEKDGYSPKEIAVTSQAGEFSHIKADLSPL